MLSDCIERRRKLASFYTSLLRKAEIEVHRAALSNALLELGSTNLGVVITVLNPRCLTEGQKDLLYRAYSGEEISRDFVINVTEAGLAICYGKLKFFEIIVDIYPDALWMTKAPDEIQIDPPLICAIDKRDPALVIAVLNNIYFLKHEYQKKKKHKAHMHDCIDYAICTYSEGSSAETTIIQMLKGVLNIRMPLISAMEQDNLYKTLLLTQMRLFCLGPSFLKHRDKHSEAHFMIVEGCKELAKVSFEDIASDVRRLFRDCSNLRHHLSIQRD